MPSPRLSPLATELARTDFADDWYRWCDANRAWSAEASGGYETDSLASDVGGYAPLAVGEFLDAFRAAGATARNGSTFPRGRHRSFTVDMVSDSGTRCSLAVQLGRGLNALECRLTVFDGESAAGDAELLHSVARDIRLASGRDVPDPASPYPRPIIGSRSQLEVVSRELVGVLARVAHGWGRSGSEGSPRTVGYAG